MLVDVKHTRQARVARSINMREEGTCAEVNHTWEAHVTRSSNVTGTWGYLSRPDSSRSTRGGGGSFAVASCWGLRYRQGIQIRTS